MTTFDNGGWLPADPMTMAVNNTGEDEPILHGQPDCGLPDGDRDGDGAPDGED